MVRLRRTPSYNSRGDPAAIRRAGGTRTPNPRFWRPVLYQIELRPSAVGTSPAAGPHTLQRSRLGDAARTRCDVGGDDVCRIRAKVPSDETGKVGADLIASHDDFFLFLIGTTTPAEASSSARRWRARKSRTFT